MTDTIHVRVHGDEDAERKIQQLALHLSDLRGFWPLVVPLFIGWMRQQFDSEGQFASGGWQALASSTVERKAAMGLRSEILQATGRLKQDASRPERTATPTSLTLTIQNDYLPFHQEGTGRMPARPLVFGSPLPAEAAAELEGAAAIYVRDLISRF